MIYMEPSQLGWEPLVASWMDKEYPSNLSAASKSSIQVSAWRKLFRVIGTRKYFCLGFVAKVDNFTNCLEMEYRNSKIRKRMTF